MATDVFPQWLVNAIARNACRKAQLRNDLLVDRQGRWEGLTEADLVDCTQKVLSGAGHLTWREWPYGRGISGRLDLFARSPVAVSGETGWAVEVKLLWDGEDQRLLGNRAKEPDEFLKDFRNLELLEQKLELEGLRCVVVWATFSDESVLRPGRGEKRLGVPDLEEEVATKVGWRISARAHVDVSEVAHDIERWRHLHVATWEPKKPIGVLRSRARAVVDRRRWSAAPNVGLN